MGYHYSNLIETFPELYCMHACMHYHHNVYVLLYLTILKSVYVGLYHFESHPGMYKSQQQQILGNGGVLFDRLYTLYLHCVLVRLWCVPLVWLEYSLYGHACGTLE